MGFKSDDYPQGLRGEQVPLEGRIIGLADGFDAMTSKRTYRAAMPLSSVTAEIRRCSGTQFDPVLVDTFLGLNLKRVLEDIRMRKQVRRIRRERERRDLRRTRAHRVAAVA